MIIVMNEKAIFGAERKAKAIDLLDGVCIDCGTTNRLQFDHINRDRKDLRHALGNMWELNWDKIIAELKKCQLLCRSCHGAKSMAERGYLPSRPIEHGTTKGYSTRKCRCINCKKAWADYKRAQWRSKNPLAVHLVP